MEWGSVVPSYGSLGGDPRRVSLFTVTLLTRGPRESIRLVTGSLGNRKSGFYDSTSRTYSFTDSLRPSSLFSSIRNHWLDTCWWVLVNPIDRTHVEDWSDVCGSYQVCGMWGLSIGRKVCCGSTTHTQNVCQILVYVGRPNWDTLVLFRMFEFVRLRSGTPFFFTFW